MVGDMIKKLRKEKNLSQNQLAKILNVHQTAISQWENKRTRPDQEVLQLIASYFDVSVDYLLGKKSTHLKAEGPVRIPVFGSIPAGIPLEAIEDIEDYEELPATAVNLERDFFALKIRGDSMAPTYLDGDVVIFAAQETCESGQDCAVMVNGSDATFKRVRVSANGITLQPLNPSYEPIVFANSDYENSHVRIIGVAKEIRRKIM